MARSTSIAAESINRILDSLPGYLSQALERQGDREFAEKQLKIRENSELFQAALNNISEQENRLELKIAEDKKQMNNILDSLSEGGISPYISEENITNEGAAVGKTLASQFAGPYQDIIKQSEENLNDLKLRKGVVADQLNQIKEKQRKYNLMKSKKDLVTSNLAGGSEILSSLDYIDYFDKNISGKIVDVNDPDYNEYRQSFIGLGPSPAEELSQLQSQVVFQERIAGQRDEVQENFKETALNFVALGIDALYDVDEDSETITGISDATKETTAYKSLVKDFMQGNNSAGITLSQDQAEEFIARELSNARIVLQSSPLKEGGMIQFGGMSGEDFDKMTILSALAPRAFSIFNQEALSAYGRLETLQSPTMDSVPVQNPSSGGELNPNVPKSSTMIQAEDLLKGI